MPAIKTDFYSAQLRNRLFLSSEAKFLIARLAGSRQETDLTVPPNCGGYGRIKHFRIHKNSNWSPDPLPNAPAAKALGHTTPEILRVQVFQLAGCNWRCWYCFVDSSRLSANLQVAKYFTAEELIHLFLAERERPNVIDLSGGQPDLVPEWAFLMMRTLEAHGLKGVVFLWSDDNLSTRYVWDFLTQDQRSYMSSFPCYSRVGCFKGYDTKSFAFNTGASPDIFERQFEVFQRMLAEGFDMYAYVTFTAAPDKDIRDRIRRFIDKLQRIHANLPLRTVPLEIETYTPMVHLTAERQDALRFQYDVHAEWRDQLVARFSAKDLSLSISDVTMTLT